MAGVTEEKRAETVPSPDTNDSGELPVKESSNDFNHLRTIDAGITENDALTELPEKEQRRILSKVDYRLVPLLTFLYLVAFVDRTNSQSTSSSAAASFINDQALDLTVTNTCFSWQREGGRSYR